MCEWRGHGRGFCPAVRTVRLGRRTHPVPLDPATWSVPQRCLDYRDQQHTRHRHPDQQNREDLGIGLLRRPTARPFEVATSTLRGTRLVDLVNSMDPKLVSAAFGMKPEGILNYLADRIDPTLEANT